MKINFKDGTKGSALIMCWQVCLDSAGLWWLEWDEKPCSKAGFERARLLDEVESVEASSNFEMDSVNMISGILDK